MLLGCQVSVGRLVEPVLEQALHFVHERGCKAALVESQDAQSKAHNDKPFYSVALRTAVHRKA